MVTIKSTSNGTVRTGGFIVVTYAAPYVFTLASGNELTFTLTAAGKMNVERTAGTAELSVSIMGVWS
jgi:hypothetical protein